MKELCFSKMVASGNDFVVVDTVSRIPYPVSPAIVRKICDRRLGIGADGLLLLGKSNKADARMRIFNADGSEAEMCGNGARCAVYYFSRIPNPESRASVRIETRAGIITGKVAGNKVRIQLTDPKGIKLNIPLAVRGRKIRANFINTGVPHTVIFVEGLDKIDVAGLGREIRYHKYFAPAGTNVNFVEVLGRSRIAVRTYERGVEGETLACGTGSAASVLIANCFTNNLRLTPNALVFAVHTRGGEVLKVYFNRTGGSFSNVWLEGGAKAVYKGEFYV
jgi:diaminopimelate epimerase